MKLVYFDKDNRIVCCDIIYDINTNDNKRKIIPLVIQSDLLLISWLLIKGKTIIRVNKALLNWVGIPFVILTIASDSLYVTLN
jgi:hypothetical protein